MLYSVTKKKNLLETYQTGNFLNIPEAKIDVNTIFNDESPVTILQASENFQTTVQEIKFNCL